jgi:selenide,water dikinase
LLNAFDVSAATDVTGFGLAGHLLEMLQAGQVAAEIDLDAVGLLPGAAELLAEGLESTLAPANRAAEDEIESAELDRSTPAYRGLFDPQTCGGLLVGVAQQQAAELVRQLALAGETEARAIGFIKPFHEMPRVRIRRASGG